MKEIVQREVGNRTCRALWFNGKEFEFYSECVGKILHDIVQGSDVIKILFLKDCTAAGRELEGNTEGMQKGHRKNNQELLEFR